MLDRHLRPLIDPPLNAAGRRIARLGIGANAVTVAGALLGIGAGAAIAQGRFGLALLFIMLSRLADGLDGAIARAAEGAQAPRRSGTETGGFIDIVADFVFYAAIPIGFVWADPATNGLAGALLLGAFYVNAATFLGFAILAERHGLQSTRNGVKNWYHAAGLLEGSETIAFFVALCLWPGLFVPLALVFAALCIVTAGARIAQVFDRFN